MLTLVQPVSTINIYGQGAWMLVKMELQVKFWVFPPTVSLFTVQLILMELNSLQLIWMNVTANSMIWKTEVKLIDIM